MAQFITDAIYEHCRKELKVLVLEKQDNFVTIYSTHDCHENFNSDLCKAMAYIEKVTDYKVRTFSHTYDYRCSRGEAVVIFDKETSTPSC